MRLLWSMDRNINIKFNVQHKKLCIFGFCISYRIWELYFILLHLHLMQIISTDDGEICIQYPIWLMLFKLLLHPSGNNSGIFLFSILFAIWYAIIAYKISIYFIGWNRKYAWFNIIRARIHIKWWLETVKWVNFWFVCICFRNNYFDMNDVSKLLPHWSAI